MSDALRDVRHQTLTSPTQPSKGLIARHFMFKVTVIYV